MYYDRRVSPSLVNELSPNGAFAELARLARTWHLADLQLRGYTGKSRCWATLYVGLTKVIDVFERNGTFWLAGKVADPTWDPAWQSAHPASWFKDQLKVGDYLRGAIGRVADRFTNEGAVQAMLCTRASHLFSVIDREAVIGFENAAARARLYEALQRPLANACRLDPSTPWFKPRTFGGELDLLAVDDGGRLLVVEIKPGSATSGIAWAPLQATFYARLFRAWADEAGVGSRTTLESMLQRRITLNLSRDRIRPLSYPLDIVPVVAIGGVPKSPKAIGRLQHVQNALLDAGEGEGAMEVWQVEETVLQTQLPAVPPTAR